MFWGRPKQCVSAIAPRLLGIDLKAAAREYEVTLGDTGEELEFGQEQAVRPIVVRVYRVTNPEVAGMTVIGDVAGHKCLIVDDICDTAGTLCLAALALKEQGAKRVVAYCTHPVLSGNAISNISNSDLDELVVTDSIPLRPDARKCWQRPSAASATRNP